MMLVNILENVNLAEHSTMRLGGQARWLATAVTDEQVYELNAWAAKKNAPVMMIGQGSNIVWRDEGYQGLVIVNGIRGREILSQDDKSVVVRIGGGEVWDEVVAWSVEQGLSGIEFLSLIPGTAGAGPVQNIGAYGAELADTLIEVEAYDTQTESYGGITNSSCGFGYRTSRFKTNDRGRFMILAIVLRLTKTTPTPPFYEALQKYLTDHNITEFTPANIRKAVIAIRRSKLPDPSVVANNGSFFTLPIIEPSQFEGLKARYPDIKGWPTKDGKVKVAAGWLVEQAGFKGMHDQATGMTTWPAQALVLVNEHARNTADLLAFKQKIVDKVQDMFGITLVQEPELLP